MNRIFQATHDKYKYLKDLIIPYTYPSLNKVRIGPKQDSGYIVDKNLYLKSRQVLSLGIGSDAEGCKFDFQCAEDGKEVLMFDESIAEPGLKHRNFKFFRQNAYSHNIGEILNDINDNNALLKADIEGWEYDIINLSTISWIENKFSQLVFEVHDLIEEVPTGWVITDKNKQNKSNPKIKVDFFSVLNQYYTLCHIHGNNHSAAYGNFPDCLELLYIRKRDVTESVIIQEDWCPKDGLDFPGWPERPDYRFKWW